MLDVFKIAGREDLLVVNPNKHIFSGWNSIIKVLAS